MAAPSMDLVVASILEGTSEEGRFKSTLVNKDIDVELDLGTLLVHDPNPLNATRLRSELEVYILDLARDNAQLLINKLWTLESERVEDVVVVKLPPSTTRIPREKPIPAEKKATKWEQFAKMKGIQNKKKGRMVYDEQSKEYKPRWGYKRANDDTQDWCIPVPDQADPNEDQFEKRIKAKKERIAKNELQRLRNLARNMKGKVPGVGLTPTMAAPDKDHLSRALVAAKTSNASMGAFTGTLPKEGGKKTGNIGKKRKFQPNVDEAGKEKRRTLEILSNLGRKEPLVDKNKAAKAYINAERAAARTDDRDGKSNRGKGFGRSNKVRPGKDRPMGAKHSGGGGFGFKSGGGKSPGGRGAGGERTPVGGKSPSGRSAAGGGKSPRGKSSGGEGGKGMNNKRKR